MPTRIPSETLNALGLLRINENKTPGKSWVIPHSPSVAGIVGGDGNVGIELRAKDISKSSGYIAAYRARGGFCFVDRRRWSELV